MSCQSAASGLNTAWRPLPWRRAATPVHVRFCAGLRLAWRPAAHRFDAHGVAVDPQTLLPTHSAAVASDTTHHTWPHQQLQGVAWRQHSIQGTHKQQLSEAHDTLQAHDPGLAAAAATTADAAAGRTPVSSQPSTGITGVQQPLSAELLPLQGWFSTAAWQQSMQHNAPHTHAAFACFYVYLAAMAAAAHNSDWYYDVTAFGIMWGGLWLLCAR